jgi:hypothetical protein
LWESRLPVVAKDYKFNVPQGCLFRKCGEATVDFDTHSLVEPYLQLIKLRTATPEKNFCY